MNMNPLNAMRSVDSVMVETGYTPKTTFWQDFSIADCYGASAVKDTFNRAFKEWKKDYIYLTELVMVLNHKMWQYAETHRNLSVLYQSLWEKADAYGQENLKGEELDYFYRTLD